MDDDGNKQLSLEEFFEGLSDCGLTVTKAQAQEMFTYFDRDGSGSLQFDEFLNGIRVRLKSNFFYSYS